MQKFWARFVVIAVDHLEQRYRRIKLPARVLFCETKIDRTNGEVRVLAACDIRQNIKHPTQTDPPRNMHARLRSAKNAVEKTRNRHERVRAIGESKCLTQQARADVKNHEYTYDERILVLSTRLDFWIQQNIFTVGKAFILGNETTNKKYGDTDEQRAAHQVGDEVENVDEGGIQKRKEKILAAIDQ